MQNDKIGTNGLGISGGYGRSPSYFGSGRKALPRTRVSRSTSARARRIKVIGLLLVAVAAVAIAAAGVTQVMPKAMTSMPAKAMAPPPPYLVSGQTFDELGNVIGSTTVVVTNNRTLDTQSMVTDSEYGYYEFDLNDVLLFPNGYLVTDVISVHATLGTWEGWNESTPDAPGNGGAMWMDITMHDTAAIPEFSMVIVPVIGMLGVVAVVSLVRRNEK